MMAETGTIADDERTPETAWRKVPDYQGGFLLDGGVHDIAVLRLIAGEDSVARLSAFTRQNQKHLPPVDTIDATMRLKSGATGTISQSFGTTFPNHSEWVFACEKGTMQVQKTVDFMNDKPSVANVVTVYGLDGKEVSSEVVQDERSGVPPEVRAWGEALTAGKSNSEQRPEEALADLEIVSLEMTRT